MNIPYRRFMISSFRLDKFHKKDFKGKTKILSLQTSFVSGISLLALLTGDLGSQQNTNILSGARYVHFEAFIHWVTPLIENKKQD
jgi:hypothetical protein